MYRFILFISVSLLTLPARAQGAAEPPAPLTLGAALQLAEAGNPTLSAARHELAAQGGAPCEMWVQSFHPTHAVFEALRTHDYPAFAAQQLQERQEAGMPPFAYQALVRADARTQEVAQAFLTAARKVGSGLAPSFSVRARIRPWASSRISTLVWLNSPSARAR